MKSLHQSADFMPRSTSFTSRSTENMPVCAEIIGMQTDAPGIPIAYSQHSYAFTDSKRTLCMGRRCSRKRWEPGRPRGGMGV